MSQRIFDPGDLPETTDSGPSATPARPVEPSQGRSTYVRRDVLYIGLFPELDHPLCDLASLITRQLPLKGGNEERSLLMARRLSLVATPVIQASSLGPGSGEILVRLANAKRLGVRAAVKGQHPEVARKALWGWVIKNIPNLAGDWDLSRDQLLDLAEGAFILGQMFCTTQDLLQLGSVPR